MKWVTGGRTAIFFAVLLPFWMSAARPAAAQHSVDSATLGGEVLDSSGGAIATAMIHAQNVATGIVRNTTAQADGRFRLGALPVGDYKLTVDATGFASAEQRVTLAVGSVIDLTFHLPPASVQERVEVVAQAPVIETARSEAGSVVATAEIASLPLNGRNTTDLALLVPSVSRTNTGANQRFAETSAVPGTGISFSGQRNLANGFIVDGVSSNDDAAGLAGMFYGQEVVREFQVVTSGGGAEFGRASAGYVNIVTRSGSNDYHGALYGFLRHDALDARNPLSTAKFPLTQTQYGATLGGPIMRGRTFFFSNFEQTRQNTAGVITISQANVNTVNQQLDAISYAGPRIYTGQYPTTLDTSNLFLRLDHQLKDNNQISVRYSFYDVNSLNARTAGGLNAASRATHLDDLDQSLGVNDAWIISSTLLNEVRFQYFRSHLDAPPTDLVGPAINISGVANFGTATFSPISRYNDLWEFADSLSIQRGNHALKTGVDVLYNDLVIGFPGALQGVYSFSGMSNFLAGTYSTYQQAFGQADQPQTNPNVGWFLQDEWRVRSSLTVNLGVRYDLQFLDGPVQTDTNNVSPRIGVAWAPFPSRHTVVRASYGLFYDRIPLRALSNALQRGGTTYRTAVLTRTQTGAPVFPAVLPSFPAGLLVSTSTIDPAIPNGYAQQANLEVEHQITPSMTLRAGYAHVRGMHIIANRNVNAPTCLAAVDPVNLCRPDPNFGNISQYQGWADSWYDGMILSLEKRAGRWSSLRISYNLSKSFDTVGNFFFSSPQDNSDLRAEKGLSDNDQRHRLTVNGTLFGPQGPARNWLERLRNGWSFSYLFSYGSALPFNVTAGSDLNGDSSSGTDRARTFNNFVTVGSSAGSVARNIGRGFDFSSFDLRVSRTFALVEGFRLQALTEAFNVLNHPNYQVPNGNFGTGVYPIAPAAGFGRPTAAADPRQMQFGLRLSF
jgi:Carboxypeptidase regulatory-like domain